MNIFWKLAGKGARRFILWLARQMEGGMKNAR